MIQFRSNARDTFALVLVMLVVIASLSGCATTHTGNMSDMTGAQISAALAKQVKP